MTHNFLNSSYVIYPNGSKIALPMFLKQTDQNIQNLAQQINHQMSGIASHLEVIDPNSTRNPFQQQFYAGMPPMTQTQTMYQPQPNYNQASQPYQNFNPNGHQNAYPSQPIPQANQNYYPAQNSTPPGYYPTSNYNPNQNSQPYNPNQPNFIQNNFPQPPFAQ